MTCLQSISSTRSSLTCDFLHSTLFEFCVYKQLFDENLFDIDIGNVYVMYVNYVNRLLRSFYRCMLNAVNDFLISTVLPSTSTFDCTMPHFFSTRSSLIYG